MGQRFHDLARGHVAPQTVRTEQERVIRIETFRTDVDSDGDVASDRSRQGVAGGVVDGLLRSDDVHPEQLHDLAVVSGQDLELAVMTTVDAAVADVREVRFSRCDGQGAERGLHLPAPVASDGGVEDRLIGPIEGSPHGAREAPVAGPVLLGVVEAGLDRETRCHLSAAVSAETVRHGKHNNGVHTVEYQVADEAGNSASGSVLVKIDSMAPRTTDDAPTTTVTTPITVTLTPLDAGCGVLCTWWTLGYGEKGKKAVRALIERGTAAGLLPGPAKIEFLAE